MRLHEFSGTGTGSIPAIDGAGLSFQPRPRRSSISKLLGDEDPKPKKRKLKEDDEEKMKADIERVGEDDGALFRELCGKLRAAYHSNNAANVREVVDGLLGSGWMTDELDRAWDNRAKSGGSFEHLHDTVSGLVGESTPRLTSSDLWEGGLAPISASSAQTQKTESIPPQTRDFFSPGEDARRAGGVAAPVQPITATGLTEIAEAGATILPTALVAGETLMNGGVLPSPPATDGGKKLIENVHDYLAH